MTGLPSMTTDVAMLPDVVATTRDLPDALGVGACIGISMQSIASLPVPFCVTVIALLMGYLLPQPSVPCKGLRGMLYRRVIYGLPSYTAKAVPNR
jgi:hypothetical protein